MDLFAALCIIAILIIVFVIITTGLSENIMFVFMAFLYLCIALICCFQGSNVNICILGSIMLVAIPFILLFIAFLSEKTGVGERISSEKENFNVVNKGNVTSGFKDLFNKSHTKE